MFTTTLLMIIALRHSAVLIGKPEMRLEIVRQG
jgi:hypothetical protein